MENIKLIPTSKLIENYKNKAKSYKNVFDSLNTIEFYHLEKKVQYLNDELYDLGSELRHEDVKRMSNEETFIFHATMCIVTCFLWLFLIPIIEFLRHLTDTRDKIKSKIKKVEKELEELKDTINLCRKGIIY